VSPIWRRAAAERAIDISAKTLDERERASIIDEALAVIALPQIAQLFAPDARAEVAVAGRLRRNDGKLIEVAGQIDRIAETATHVLVADFKTGAAYAQDAIPAPFVTQMALYAAVLAPLWPNKSLQALLIFTNGPKVINVPPARLDEALQAIGFESVYSP
jgi:ATP-dependent helicase/nuclease subunit A